MKVLNLRCAHDHRFEGWFASDADFHQQRDGGLIECPLCGDAVISRLPTAPRLNVSKAREPQEAQGDASPDVPQQITMQAAWLKAARHVIANTDDVGERFAEEARRIHYGEIRERAIRGRATRDEARSLREEGIEVMPLPLPPALKDPLQ